ncbi:hypothetical protein DRO33_04670 [Candidatus Bathyarchaeota archaeon]|nr:MAG: hypothetical protein DRO33_04670 [Candidatus Bathyarchaeota archaeon]
MSKLVWPSYAVGAGAVLAVSLGAALVAYGLGLLTFKAIHLLAWFFGPLGIYTLAYGLVKAGEKVYYIFWGLIMIFLALLTPAHLLGWPLLPFAGILILLIASLAVIAYLAGRRS